MLDAVNCVVRDGRRLVGHNTDGAGFLASLADEVGFAPAGRRCVVLGAGGAARAVIAGAGRRPAPPRWSVVNRTADRARRGRRSLAGDGAGG